MMPLVSTPFSPARVMFTIARLRAHLPPVSRATASRRSMLSMPAYARAVLERHHALANDEHRPRRRLAVEDEVIEAVHAEERREVITGVGVEEHAGFRRPRRAVAARRARHQAGQQARSEDQRDVRVAAATAFRRAAGRGSTCWRRGRRAACASRRAGVNAVTVSRRSRSTNSVAPCEGNSAARGISLKSCATLSRIPMQQV